MEHAGDSNDAPPGVPSLPTPGDSPVSAAAGLDGTATDSAATGPADAGNGRRHTTLPLTRPAELPARHTTLPWPYLSTEPRPDIHDGNRAGKVALRTLAKAWHDSLFRLSAEGAFWSALSTAPLLLALLGLVGFVGQWFGPDALNAVQDEVLVVLHGIFSGEVVDGLLKENVAAMLQGGQADLVSVGFFISLWAGSSAISSLIESITIAYGQYEVRHPVAERLFALVLYLVALVGGTLILPLLAIGPETLISLFPQGIRAEASAIISVAYYPALVISLVVLLTTLYKVAPRHKHPWRRGIPGALLGTLVFVVASMGLRIYVSYVYTHGLTYGALATPITFLLFYYMMTLAIVLGAQFNNATLEYFPARVSRRELRKWRRVEPGSAADEATPYEDPGAQPVVPPSSQPLAQPPQSSPQKAGYHSPGSDR